MSHSVDDRLFLTKQDSTRLLHLLTRFASEPQMSIYQNPSSTLHAHPEKNPDGFALSSDTVSNTRIQFDIGDIQFEEIFHFNCDKNQPVFTATADDQTREQVDQTSPSASDDHELINQQIDQDILVDASPSIQETDSSGDRHFRRRKRRSSITRTSISLDDTPTLTDATGKIDIHRPLPSPSVNENVESSLSIQAKDALANTTPTLVADQDNGNTQTDEETPSPLSRYRGRSKSRQQSIVSSFYQCWFSLLTRTKTSILSSSGSIARDQQPYSRELRSTWSSTGHRNTARSLVVDQYLSASVTYQSTHSSEGDFHSTESESESSDWCSQTLEFSRISEESCPFRRCCGSRTDSSAIHSIHQDWRVERALFSPRLVDLIIVTSSIQQKSSLSPESISSRT